MNAGDVAGKEIEYTRHARRRVNERFISEQDVENGILNEDFEEAYGDKKKVVHRINGKSIEVILKPKHNKILVITVYWE